MASVVEERVALSDLSLPDVEKRDGLVIGGVLVARIKLAGKVTSLLGASPSNQSRIVPVGEGEPAAGGHSPGKSGRQQHVSKASRALFSDIRCLLELTDKYAWFDAMVDEIRKAKIFTRSKVVNTELDLVTLDDALKMGTSFVPTLRLKSQPHAGVLMWVNQYPAMAELTKQHEFLVPMFNVVAEHILMSAPWGVKLRAGFGAAVSVFDALTDVYMLVRYARDEEFHAYALVTGLLLGTSMILQFAVVTFQNSRVKNLIRTIACESVPILLCMKPVVDAYRVATSQKRKKHKRFDHLTEMGITRGIEMFSESIPQAILQTYVFISIAKSGANENFEDSSAILLTIFSSVLSASYCSANISYDFDISPKSRAKNEKFYGYIPDEARGRTIVFFSLIASSSFHLLMKCISSALLCTMGFKYFGMFIVGDTLLFFVYKLFRRDFYHWLPTESHGAAVVVTLLMRSVIKIINDFTGIVQFRNSVDLGGAFWTFSQIMSQAVAFVTVFFYLRMGTAKTGLDASEERKLWIAMFGLLAGYIMSNVAFFSNIKREYYRTFFNTKTGYDAIRDSFYESGDEGKAEAVFTNSRFHVASFQEDTKKWVSENWISWQETRPLWLEDWIAAKIPEDWVPKAGRADWQRRRGSVVGGGEGPAGADFGGIEGSPSVIRMVSNPQIVTERIDGEESDMSEESEVESREDEMVRGE
ncbi:hypothetical protein TrST_g5584 [Triparma strigata]|uniref:Uncharacterized protein n=1 Tax=Triparma strigata TaxID=1606541 RepID=A0A9W7B4U4_9STRA|nr:hypothetical protein TrST_g5584 [Triparma strigata]